MARGRPRKFDEEEVLAEAAKVFRDRGYACTSMQALSEAMKMGEQSIYNAFGSKEQVFQRALSLYCEKGGGRMAALIAPDASLESLKSFFLAAIDEVVDGSGACLVTQTCLSLEGEAKAAADSVSTHMRNIEIHFQKVLENAVANGEIQCEDTEQTARFLNLTMQGLGVLANSGTSKTGLIELVETTFKLIR